MKRSILLVLVTALVFAPVAAPADCPAPTLETHDRVVAAGERITVSGEHWIECNDTSACWSGRDEPKPFTDISVMLKGPDRFYELGLIDATDDGTFILETTMPKVPAGGYRIVVGESAGHYGARAAGFVTVTRR